jgi:hypothetical protein
VANTFAGRVHVEWDNGAPVTPFGQMPFFLEFIKQGVCSTVADCPLHYTSPNAPPKRDVIGTIFLSVLAGHSRYAHTTVGCDSVNPPLLGMRQRGHHFSGVAQGGHQSAGAAHRRAEPADIATLKYAALSCVI